MDQFNPQTIANLLLIGVVLVIAVMGFRSWCKRVDGQVYDPLRDGPEDHGRNAGAAEDWEGLTLAGPVPPMRAADALPASLRTPLPYVRKMGLEANVQAQMMADTLRASKLS